MEGYLKKWTNIVTRWQDRYFILNDHILHYCEHQGGQSKGQIHLKVAAIILVPEDPLRIILNTGTNEIQLRASSVPEKIEWVNALKRAQESCQETISRDYIKEVNDILTDIWVTQAAFDETLNILVPKLERQPKYVELAEKLSELGQKIKMNVTICTQLLEVEKEKLETQQSGDNQTLFQSFRNISSRIDDFNRQSSAISSSSSLSIQDILEPLKYEQPVKYKNLINNPVFQKIQFTNQQLRTALPRTQDPNEKLKVWSLIKDLIGKDLSKFAVPVYFNEPLSMLQRLAENLEYYQTLIEANQEQDQWLRMCYVMGFGVSAYSSNIDRHKKPFNPILGETFEIQNKQFRFVSEQVSHHPPISAGFAESNDFEMQMQTDLQTKMSPRSMEVQPIGNVYIKLKQCNDQISYNKCTTKVHNIIFGNMYIEHIGDMVFHNHTTNDKGVLTLSENFKMVGTVCDSHGKEKYKLKGQWNDQLIALNVQTGQETVVWKRYDLPQDYKNYFYFTKFAMNLNLLNIDLIKSLPCSDCRLRPDQLALEYGFIDLAADEKHRLEQKQRQRRKEMQNAGQKHMPQFFELIKEPCTNEMVYKYRGNYWRKKGEGMDLF
ncbi:unnamed protein product [Paramecium octaurelia]|uniref:PH domain-containing protein n=1 Tax=Paramecium octaurelia TaxID=43137 RepID=A0A8S1WHZ9_PAROT|nr:unnamed protein product [Paramecium octaurelia]